MGFDHSGQHRFHGQRRFALATALRESQSAAAECRRGCRKDAPTPPPAVSLKSSQRIIAPMLNATGRGRAETELRERARRWYDGAGDNWPQQFYRPDIRKSFQTTAERVEQAVMCGVRLLWSSDFVVHHVIERYQRFHDQIPGECCWI